jgi:hypothetical protein
MGWRLAHSFVWPWRLRFRRLRQHPKRFLPEALRERQKAILIPLHSARGVQHIDRGAQAIKRLWHLNRKIGEFVFVEPVPAFLGRASRFSIDNGEVLRAVQAMNNVPA